MRIRQQSGFTLVELIIVLFIVILLVAWGVPAYRDFKLRQDMTSSANEMIYSFTLARAEAIRRGNNVLVTATGADWASGWQVINVPDNQILAQQDRFQQGFQLNLTLGVPADLEFDNLGGLINQPVAFTLTHPDLTTSRRIQINASGSAKVVVL